MEGGESKAKVPSVWILGEYPLPGSQMAALALYLHMAERGSSGVSDLSYKGTNSTKSILASWLPLNLITSQRPLRLIHHIGGQGFNIWILGMHIQFLTVCNCSLWGLDAQVSDGFYRFKEHLKILKNLPMGCLLPYQ